MVAQILVKGGKGRNCCFKKFKFVLLSLSWQRLVWCTHEAPAEGVFNTCEMRLQRKRIAYSAADTNKLQASGCSCFPIRIKFVLGSRDWPWCVLFVHSFSLRYFGLCNCIAPLPTPPQFTVDCTPHTHLRTVYSVSVLCEQSKLLGLVGFSWTRWNYAAATAPMPRIRLTNCENGSTHTNADTRSTSASLVRWSHNRDSTSTSIMYRVSLKKVCFSKSASYHCAMCPKVISFQKVVKMR